MSCRGCAPCCGPLASRKALLRRSDSGAIPGGTCPQKKSPSASLLAPLILHLALPFGKVLQPLGALACPSDQFLVFLPPRGRFDDDGHPTIWRVSSNSKFIRPGSIAPHRLHRSILKSFHDIGHHGCPCWCGTAHPSRSSTGRSRRSSVGQEIREVRHRPERAPILSELQTCPPEPELNPLLVGMRHPTSFSAALATMTLGCSSEAGRVRIAWQRRGKDR